MFVIRGILFVSFGSRFGDAFGVVGRPAAQDPPIIVNETAEEIVTWPRLTIKYSMNFIGHVDNN